MNETQEYLEIMAGRKRLDIEYKEGDIVSGYTAIVPLAILSLWMDILMFYGKRK